MSKRGTEPAYPVDPQHPHNVGRRIDETVGMSVRLRIASEQMAASVAADVHDAVPINEHVEFALELTDALLAAEEETR